MSYKPNENQDDAQNDETNGLTLMPNMTTIDQSFINFIQGKNKHKHQLAPGQSITDYISMLEAANNTTVVNNNCKTVIKQKKVEDKIKSDAAQSSIDYAKEFSTMKSKNKLPQQPLKSQQEIIKDLQDEILELKIQNFKLKMNSSTDQITAIDSTDKNKKFMSQILQKNEDLKRKLDDKRRQLKDTQIQTDLDTYGMEELWKARLFENKYKQEQQLVKRNEQLLKTDSLVNKNKDKHSRPQSSVMKNYNSEALSTFKKPYPERSSSHQDLVDLTRYANLTTQMSFNNSNLDNNFNIQQMSQKEKKILEEFFRLDGIMTTTLDKLRTVSETQHSTR